MILERCRKLVSIAAAFAMLIPCAFVNADITDVSKTSSGEAVNLNITANDVFIRNVFRRNEYSYYDIGGGGYTGLYSPEDIEREISISPRDGIVDCTYIRFSDGTDPGMEGRRGFTISYDANVDLYSMGDSLNITYNGHILSSVSEESYGRSRTQRVYTSSEVPGLKVCVRSSDGYYYYAFSIQYDPAFVYVDMYRLYNPNSGEHFYTSSEAERDMLIGVGWTYEGIGWVAPDVSDTPVYRLYNSNGGEHHYTTSVAERDMLVGLGWNDEGIGWYSDDNCTVPLYRQYNPNAFANNHNYTTSLAENNWLVSIGWQAEGVGWYGVG